MVYEIALLSIGFPTLPILVLSVTCSLRLIYSKT